MNLGSIKYRLAMFKKAVSYRSFDSRHSIKPIFGLVSIVPFALLIFYVWRIAGYVVFGFLAVYFLVKIFKRIREEIYYHYEYVVKSKKSEGITYESRITDPPIRR